mgnify:CR=1 FL=1
MFHHKNEGQVNSLQNFENIFNFPAFFRQISRGNKEFVYISDKWRAAGEG